MKDTIIQDIITAANFKLAGYLDLLEKEAAGKGGISNPMGGSSTSTATKGVKTAPVMSAAPINDLLPKATTAQSANLPALTQLPTANTAISTTQSGVMNNAVLPMMKSSELKLANIFASNGFFNPATSSAALNATVEAMPQTRTDALKTLAAPVTGYAAGSVNGLIPQALRTGAKKVYKSFPKDSNNPIKRLAGNSAALMKKLQQKGVNMTRPISGLGQALYLPAFLAGISPLT